MYRVCRRKDTFVGLRQEFQGRLEKVEPKGKRPVGAFETGRIEDGSVKMVAVGARGELTSRS